MTSITYHRATTKCTAKVIRQTYNFKLPTVLLFIEFNTTMALAIRMKRDFVSAGVRTVGMKLLKVISIKNAVF